VKSGYTFGGWNTQTDGSGTTLAAGSALTADLRTTPGTVTLYAKWTVNKYTLTYDANGGWLSDDGTPAGSIDYGATVTLPTSGTRTGYTLTNFTLSGGLSGSYNPGASFTMPAGAVTATANWTAGGYSLTYNANGGELTGGTPEGSIAYGTMVTLPTSATKTGYTFTGFTLSGATSGSYGTGVTFTMPAGAVTATANWTPITYTIEYSGNGSTGGSAPADQTKTYGTSLTLAAQGGLVKSGYTFGGWNTQADGSGTTHAAGSALTADLMTTRGTVTLYAKWTANTYTVAYNPNGGSGTTASSAHTYDVAMALTANGFTRDGYIFLGWATSSTGAVAYTDGQSVTNLSATAGATVTLYAVWGDAGSFNLSTATGTGSGWTYDTSTRILTINNGGNVRVHGGPYTFPIRVTAAGTATIRLDGATINTTASSAIAMDTSGANVTLVLSGTNTVRSSGNIAPGINVPAGATLRIEGEGALTATGGSGAAGIGTNTSTAGGGAITIAGGTVTANGGYNAPGIGFAKVRDVGGSITITGGTVTASCGTGATDCGAGIGGGLGMLGSGGITTGYGTGNAPAVTISGGNITARGSSSGGSAGIGGGMYGAGGTVTIDTANSTGTAAGVRGIGPGTGGSGGTFNGGSFPTGTPYRW